MNKNFLWLWIMLFLCFSCKTTKVVTNTRSEAVAFEKTGNYGRATNAWLKYFNESAIENIEGADFAAAAKTALIAGDTMHAKGWFDQARYKNYADSSMYLSLAGIYNSEKNMTKELSALEFYSENYEMGNSLVNARMFTIYSEFDFYDKAESAWKGMGAESRNDINNLENYFDINKKLENTQLCDSIANAMLNLNADNIDALEWNAVKYYKAGLDRYEQEMAKYNKNKTRKAYKVLLKQLDIATADFKEALPFLNELWKIDRNKKYAGYLANIYARFGDEKKTNYYKGFME